jgi:KDEL-tailed cysteine endopeptidase
MEGALAISNGTLISLSEQQLIDCTIDGCEGGIMNDAFDYASDRGMCTENEYGYTGTESYCHLCRQSVVFSGCVDVTSEYEPHLQQAVSLTPVSVAIDAGSSIFQLYVGGIIDQSVCGTDLNHGVLIVGYGEEKGTTYWLVKNSWGPSWGEKGYFRVERDVGGEGACGIAVMPSYPLM